MTKWFSLLVSNSSTFWSKFQVEKVMICSSDYLWMHCIIAEASLL
jgi:hypothetical protein